MTNEQINHLVAEKVMGWRREHYSNGGGYWHRRADCKRGKFSSTCDCNGWYRTPDFTTDPAASKQVREKLAERFVFTGLLRRADYLEVDSKPFRFYVQDGLTPIQAKPLRFEAWADTEEQAVVLCALKSVGVEVDAPAAPDARLSRPKRCTKTNAGYDDARHDADGSLEGIR